MIVIWKKTGPLKYEAAWQGLRLKLMKDAAEWRVWVDRRAAGQAAVDQRGGSPGPGGCRHFKVDNRHRVGTRRAAVDQGTEHDVRTGDDCP